MASTPKPVRKAQKKATLMRQKVNKELMHEGKSKYSPDIRSNVKRDIETIKQREGKAPSKRKVARIKQEHRIK